MSSLNHQPLTALVTGATSGLGKAIALRLARDGLQVIVVGRDAARGAAVVAQIKAAGGQARFLAADLSDPADIKRLAEEVGDIDVLVNNAGLSVWAPTEDMSVADFDCHVRQQRPRTLPARRCVRPGHGEPGAPAASSTSAAWPGASACRLVPPTGRPKPRWIR